MGGSANCVIYAWFYHAWGAFAASSKGHVGSGYGWSTISSDDARSRARSSAISNCQNVGGRSCYVAREEATGGVPGQGDGGSGPYFNGTQGNFYYAALGDSYSAGAGVDPNYPNGLLGCRQSAMAYPALLKADVPTLGKLGFIACYGAETDDFYATSSANLSQLTSLELLPNVLSVTLTIGGNDIGFAPVIQACLNQSKDCYKAQQNAVNARINALAGKGKAKTPEGKPIHALTDLLAYIHRDAPNARIFVAGYPRLFGTNPKTYPGRVCYLRTVHGIPTEYIRYDDAQSFDQAADRLNGVLASAVAKSGVPATFVSVRAAFTTHGDCDTGQSWFTPVNLKLPLKDIGDTALHPNATGQRAYEKNLRAAERI